MKKTLSVFLVLMLMFSMLVGCGKSKKDSNTGKKNDSVTTQNQSTGDDEPEDINVDQPKDDPVETPKKNGDNPFTKEFMKLDSYGDVLNTFKEFGFVSISKSSEKDFSWSFHWINLGSEEIDGQSTEHIKVTKVENGETMEFEAWYDSSWNAVKLKNERGEKNGLDASFEGASLTVYTQHYLNFIALARMTFDDEGNVNDFMYTMKGKRDAGESVDLGTGTPTQIDFYEVEDKIYKNDKILGISTINGAQMYTVIENVNKESGTVEGLRLTHAVPR